MTAPAIEHSMRRQTEAAKALLVDLRNQGADDDGWLGCAVGFCEGQG